MKNVRKRTLALLLALILALGCMIGGTIAWLTAQTTPVNNVFTTSDINITLEETGVSGGTKEFKMIPGWTIKKDPKVTVLNGSEDCYLFVKIDGRNALIAKNSDNKTYSLGDYIVYAVEGDWTALDETKYPNVFYRVVDDEKSKNIKYSILGEGSYTDSMGTENLDDDETVEWSDNHVATKPSVTKEMMNEIADDKEPTLSFTAYAVQLWKTNEVADDSEADVNEAIAAQFTPEEAWEKVKPSQGN